MHQVWQVCTEWAGLYSAAGTLTCVHPRHALEVQKVHGSTSFLEDILLFDVHVRTPCCGVQLVHQLRAGADTESQQHSPALQPLMQKLIRKAADSCQTACQRQGGPESRSQGTLDLPAIKAMSNTNHREQQHCRQQEQQAVMHQQMQLCHVSSRGGGPAISGRGSWGLLMAGAGTQHPAAEPTSASSRTSRALSLTRACCASTDGSSTTRVRSGFMYLRTVLPRATLHLEQHVS